MPPSPTAQASLAVMATTSCRCVSTAAAGRARAARATTAGSRRRATTQRPDANGAAPHRPRVLREPVLLRLRVARIAPPVRDTSLGHVRDAPEDGLLVGVAELGMAADGVGFRLVVREHRAQVVLGDGARGRGGQQFAASIQPDRAALGVRGIGLERHHPVARVVVRVREVIVGVQARDLGVGGAALDVRQVAAGIAQHVVVRGRAVRRERHRHHLVQGSRPHHLEHLMRPRDPHALVVG